ncbi:MAG: glycoside hydrolase family 9 protein [Fibrobacter sp.]|nr:glycoside hydrolase family 9 protein [Fibrobacter sp.]
MKRLFFASLGFVAFANAAATFYYNQVGYDKGKPVTVIVKNTTDLGNTAYSLFKDGAVVSTGTLSQGFNPDNWLSAGSFYTIDLGSDLSAGTYTVQLADGSTSGAFTVSEYALSTNTLSTVLDYFYDDRADDPYIFNLDASIGIYGSSERRNVQGGWYDASGDVSKYFSHLSYANYLNPQQIPLSVWVLAFTAEHIPTYIAAVAASAKTDPQTEALYGADFLLRMLSPEGYFYMTVFDGWGDPASTREICAFSGPDGDKSADYQTAFREGGGMAIAALAKASTLEKDGDSTRAQYLAGAIRAFEHLQSKQTMDGACAYCDDGKENIIDDYTALLAATELYAATGDKSYLMTARTRAIHLIGRLSETGFFWSDDAKTRPFWHASDAGLPLIALIRYAEVEAKLDYTEHDESLEGSFANVWACPTCLGCGCSNNYAQTALATVKTHYDWLIRMTNQEDNPFGYARQTYLTDGKLKDGFFIPHDNESGYWWQGEDARIASLSAAVAYAATVLNEPRTESEKYATNQLDWILGKNPYGVCMMYGKGLKNPRIYDGQSNYDATLAGGIANGITGKNVDGSGIAWDSDGVGSVGFTESWQNWRWIEQWIPHTTWYLMALATRYDEVSSDLSKSTLPKAKPVATFSIQQQNRLLTVSLKEHQTGKVLTIANLNGQRFHREILASAKTTVNLENLPNGIYMVQVNGLGSRKILVK